MVELVSWLHSPQIGISFDSVISEIISIYNWLSRRAASAVPPTNMQSLISGAGIGLLVYSAYMGGELVYK